MINPSDVIKYDRTDAELEEFFLFCAVVAGKTATTQARLLDSFLSSVYGATPFDKIRRLIRNNMLMTALRISRLGQYGRLCKLMEKCVDLDLRNCNIDDLEAIPGCGPKTSRMFLMHSRPKQRLAAIDTHVLKHLAKANVKVPKATPPSGANYRRLEQDFIRLADEAHMDVAEYDLMVWRSYAEKETT